ncbi:MAG: N-acetylmuramoyl-L-alanine amidase [Butyricicoccus sp.]
MAKFNVHAGHNPAGKIGCGAVGVLDESVENRKVIRDLIAFLEQQGHTVYNCTCDNGTGQTDILKKIVSKCNAHTVACDLSIHLNSGGGHGTECLICGRGGNAEKYANKIQNAIVKRTGYADRGVKVRKDLYVLKNTDAPAVLVECCFVDSADDAKRWDAKIMAAAICEGLTGQNPLEYTVRVTSDEVNIRQKAGKTSAKVGTAKKGEVFTVVDETSNWLKLQSGKGWIAKKHVEKI